MTEIAVSIQGVGKKFRLYRERNQSLKAAFLRRKVSSHREFWAIRNISFDVPRGSTFALIGSNGSGKSTLLKCLARILFPNEGRIVSEGRIASLLEVGSGFHPELTGRENVYLNGSILGMSRKEVDEKFDSIVEFSEIGDFIDQPVKNYSSGMYVRLGFSVAIHVEPDVLVVDEILAVGDASFQEKSRRKFEELKQQGKTVILVSHSLGTVLEMCDYAAWIEKGELRQVGPVKEVAELYTRSQFPLAPEFLEAISQEDLDNLGVPKTPVTPISDFGGGLVQGFMGGALCWSRKYGVFRVLPPVQDFFNAAGGIAQHGWPLEDAHESRDGSIVQKFELSRVEIPRDRPPQITSV